MRVPMRCREDVADDPLAGVVDEVVLGGQCLVLPSVSTSHSQTDGGDDVDGVQAGHDDRAGVQRLRPFDGVAQGHRREAEHRRLLADRAAVRQHARGLELQPVVVGKPNGSWKAIPSSDPSRAAPPAVCGSADGSTRVPAARTCRAPRVRQSSSLRSRAG